MIRLISTLQPFIFVALFRFVAVDLKLAISNGAACETSRLAKLRPFRDGESEIFPFGIFLLCFLEAAERYTFSLRHQAI